MDTVVIGAGSAGCVVAARLANDPRHRIALIEGGRDFGPFDSGRWPAALLDASRDATRAEHEVTSRGGTYTFCDTDSLAIVANEHSGPVTCPGGHAGRVGLRDCDAREQVGGVVDVDVVGLSRCVRGEPQARRLWPGIRIGRGRGRVRRPGFRDCRS